MIRNFAQKLKIIYSKSKNRYFDRIMASNSDQNPFEGSINELETALKAFVSIYNIDLIENKTNHEMFKKTGIALSEQNKSNIEQLAEDLYEKAHSLETLFLKNRLEISKKAPEQLIQEEIKCLKAELKRKDELLADTKDKLANCENAILAFGNSLDNQLKIRLDMTTQNYFPNENLGYPGGPSMQQPSTSGASSGAGNPGMEQQSSVDNSVILIQ